VAVRSRRLWGPVALPAASAAVVVYTVPAGRTAVVRGLVTYNDLGIANQITLKINGALWWGNNFANNQLVAVVPTEVVLSPGDVLRCSCTLASHVTGFGSLLDGVPT